MAPTTSGAAKYTFDPKAYAKAVMHCCKHSSDACLGVFVGQSNGKTLQITDAMPLFHTHSLAPMLKVAFTLIEQHCKGLGLEIVGIYHTTAQGGTEMTPVKPIADKVAAAFSGASVWSFDAAKLSATGQQFAFTGMYHSKDEWKSVGADVDTGLADEALKRTSRLVSEMKYLELVDFDDHLGTPALNWLNPDLFKGDKLMDPPLAGAR